jgi:hypothetical protein
LQFKTVSDPQAPQSGGKHGDLILTPLELIDRIAALIPPPRIHRHRYYGVLAPNSPLRAALTAMAQAQLPADKTVVDAPVIGSGGGDSPAQASQTKPVAPKRASAARHLWAALIARIYEVFPLLCPQCGGQMNLIAFITEGPEVRKILTHTGAEPEAPRITPARGPPLWEDYDAPQSEAAGGREPDWDFAPQVALDDQFDQRISW